VGDPAARPLLPRPEFISLGVRPYLHLAADFYWLQLINLVGRANTPEEYRNLSDYAQLITDVDPSFEKVYSFAGLIIPYKLGRERWANTRESTALLEKGIRALPDSFEVGYRLVYNWVFFDHRYREAADLARHLSTLPGTPEYLRAFATRLYAVSGDFDSGLQLAMSLRDAANDEESRSFFEHRVLEIQQERLLQELEAAARAFSDKTGHLPKTPADLVAAGLLSSLPTDPLEGTLTFDASGKALSSASAKRFQIFDQDRRQSP
jgi:hypothetical protein